MSQFIKLGRDNFRHLTVRMNPEREYSSGSSGVGITGSVHLFSHTSSVEYSQVFDDNISEYPSGKWWGSYSDDKSTSTGQMASFMSGNLRSSAYKAVNTESLWGNSPHNMRDHGNTGIAYFAPKSNPEFFITRNTPFIKAEQENLLYKGDVFTYIVNDNVRYWSIDTSDKYETVNGFVEVDETEFKSNKWFDKLDILDLNSSGIPPMDDGEYKGFKVLGERQFLNHQTLHKIYSSRTQKDISKVNVMKDVLMPYYKVEYPTMDYSYANYHCINFFTSSIVSDSAALIYRSPQGVAASGIENNELDFGLSSSFTIETWIKPSGIQSSAGTLLHYSGNYALSLITASSDLYEYGDDRFKLLLQLSSSTYTNPSLVTVDVSNNVNLVFTSSHSLKKNHWHHVAVRWDKDINIVGNTSRGDFIIDGNVDSSFYISGSVLSRKSGTLKYAENREGLRAWTPGTFGGVNAEARTNDPRQLVVGNYFSGDAIYGYNSSEHSFFNNDVSDDEGLKDLDGDNNDGDPATIDFSNPLNAEIHELRIWKDWKTIDNIQSNMSTGLSNKIVTNASSSGLKFYLPLLFVEQVSTQDQFKYTPKKTQELIRDESALFASSSTEIHPYPLNVPLAMGTNGHEINIQNFLRDFARKQNANNTSGMPRLYKLTSSISSNSATDMTSSNELLESPEMLRRNLTIFPCDNGKFVPNFDLCSVLTESSGVSYPHGRTFRSSFKNYNAINTNANANPTNPTYDYSLINLDNLCFVKNNFTFTLSDLSSSSGNVICSPRFPAADYVYLNVDIEGSQSVLHYLPQMLQSSASNQVVCFDVPTLFYGDSIKNGSFYIKDSNISGSDSQFNVTLRDDGMGGLYRNDCKTEAATWNNVGNIFYNEGLALVKSPHLYLFGKNNFSVGFSGSVDKHVSTLEFEIPAVFANSSSNSGYKGFVSESPEKRSDNTIISNVNVFDKDFNIVARVNFSQAIAKEQLKDRLYVKLRMDH
jgi:hypothetical protein